MKKVNQPVDSVNTSGLTFPTQQEQVAAVVAPVAQAVIAEVEEKKVEPKASSKKKEVENDDVVPMSTFKKVSDSDN